MTSDQTPALTALVLVTHREADVRDVLAALAAQDDAAEMEVIVLAGPGAEPATGDAPLLRGASWDTGVLLAAGVRAARAPLVGITEDHAVPEAGWSRALRAAHARGHAAIGPALRNGNPETALSWGNFLLSYGPWVDPAPAGPVDDLPEVNAAFDRAALLALEGPLERVLGKGGDPIGDLRRAGRTAVLEPGARVAHRNVTGWRSTVRYRVPAGRLYADARQRAGGWGPARRALYLMGSPLIPWVRLVRIVGDRRRRGGAVTPRMVLGLVAALLLDAVGQAQAFARGAGTSRAVLRSMADSGLRRS